MAFERISIDPRIQSGQPCLKGTRLTVRRILDIVATYPDRSEMFREFPELDEDGICAALRYAAANLEDRGFPLAESA